MTMGGAAARLPVDALLGLNLMPRGPSYTLTKLLEGMVAPSMPVALYSPLNRWPTDLPFPVHNGRGAGVLNRLRVPYRVASRQLRGMSEKRLLRKVAGNVNDQVVFTWGEISLATSVKLSELGQRVVREKFNCAKSVSKEILDEAYAELGATTASASDALIEKERHELSIADAIFCPSPMVRKSLLSIGIDGDRLLDTSYGWEPARFAGAGATVLPDEDGLTILFVGYVCVRKGAHLLLQAWRDAKIRGRLVLVGAIEPLIQERYASILAQDNVVYLPYTDDIASYYRAADWFIFPTLEEGGPQVTYEAAGNGLPLLVSPMGAGAFARDGVDGRIVERMDVATWTDALRSLPDLAAERDLLAANARAHADDFTYDKVGGRRRVLLQDHFGTS